MNEASTETPQHTKRHSPLIKSSLCLRPKATVVFFALPLNCHCPFCCLCTTVSLLEPQWKCTLNIKRVIKNRNETAVLMLRLRVVCLMMKVTLGYVADFQTHQDHPDWWSGSGCQWWFMRRENKCGLASLRHVKLLMTVFSVWSSQHVCEKGCSAQVNETAPPARLKLERRQLGP